MSCCIVQQKEENMPASLSSVIFFDFFTFLIEFIVVTLFNKIMQVSGVQFCNTSSVYCTVCSPPQVKSPFITLYPSTLLDLSHPPFPLVSPYCCLCLYVVVLKGLNLPISFVFKGNSLFILCASQNYTQQIPSQKTIVIVTGVLKCLYCTDKVCGSAHYSESGTKCSVPLMKPCGHPGWLSVYSCISLSFLAQKFWPCYLVLLDIKNGGKAKS